MSALQNPLIPQSALTPVDDGPPGEPFPARDPFPWGHLAVSLALLAGAGAAVALLVAQLGLAPGLFDPFLQKNTLGKGLRMVLLTSLLTGAGIPVLAGGASVLWWGRRALLPLRRVADLLCPLGLTFLLPSLFDYSLWHDKPLPYLLQLAVFGLMLEQALRRALTAVPSSVYEWGAQKAARLTPTQRKLLPLAVVLLGCAAYSAYFSYFTILNHRRLGTAGFDLGINVNWCYNALHGQPFRTTVLFGPAGGNMIASHAIYGMLVLWLPFYAIHPSAEALLIYQAAIVGCAALPLYMFAQTQLPRWSAVLVAFAYLMFAPVHGPNFYDFHELLPALFFHFWLYFAIATNRYWLVALVVPALFSIREDVSVGIAVLGAYLVITGIRPRFGALLSVLSVGWFVLDKFVLMPWAGPWWFANLYEELLPEGEHGYGAIVQTILINPAYFFGTLLREVKLAYALHMFAPLAFLPARRWALLFLALPGFFFTLMTTNYAPTVSISFQYTTHWVPYLFAASVLALRVIGRGEGGAVRRRAALGAVAFSLFSHSYIFGAVLQHKTFVGGFHKIEFQMTESEKVRYRELKRLADMVPRTASIASTDAECPHVAARIDVYTLRDYHGNADYLLINKTGLGFGNTRKTIQSAFSSNTYGLLSSGSDFYLFKKDHVSPETQAARSALGI